MKNSKALKFTVKHLERLTEEAYELLRKHSGKLDELTKEGVQAPNCILLVAKMNRDYSIGAVDALEELADSMKLRGFYPLKNKKSRRIK